MRRFKLTILFLALALAAAAGLSAAQKSKEPAKAQSPAAEKSQPPAPVVYSVHYAIYELENGKRLNSRSYTLMAAGSGPDRGSVRVGGRVPFSIHPGSPQYQYNQVGMSIDCTIPAVSAPARQVIVSTNINWDFTPGDDKATRAPVFTNLQFSGPSLVRLNKPTVIGALDDTTSDRQFQIEVTVKKVE